MIAPPDALVHALEPWNRFYSHSKMTQTIVTFLHVGGLLLAGGLAIAADRSTLRALRIAAHERPPYLNELKTVHRWVISGLGIVVVSGLALLASDIETFFGSGIFWIKMVLVIALLVNGLMMTRAETQLLRDAGENATAWRALHRIAVTSFALWFATAALGVALVNFS
ncbi:MAG TPA: hypothetical protein VGM50_02785 [Gemmatimonadaceae bacterium]|jgi:hypothetical protein